jgi:hypothetical protein
MRRLLLGAAALTALAAAAPAAGKTAYCSPTGDYCTSVARVKHVRYLQLSTFSFTGRVKICVRDPTATRTCHSYPLRKSGPLFQVRVIWKRHYPNPGPGTYRVTFFVGTAKLGPALTFTLRG